MPAIFLSSRDIVLAPEQVLASSCFLLPRKLSCGGIYSGTNNPYEDVLQCSKTIVLIANHHFDYCSTKPQPPTRAQQQLYDRVSPSLWRTNLNCVIIVANGWTNKLFHDSDLISIFYQIKALYIFVSHGF